jgi:hypothetical protein|tara:strand:- start:127 stop:318 length:192 start_codon:yes stop_codon:yes gene_type:complete
MAKDKNWIQKMHMKKDALRDTTKTPKGKNITKKALDKASKSSNSTTRKRAALAKTFRSFRRKA